jgi:hypothetical protein
MKPIRRQAFGGALLVVLGAACIDLDSLRPPPDAGAGPGPGAEPGTGGAAGTTDSSSGGGDGTSRFASSSMAYVDFDGDGINEIVVVDNLTGQAKIYVEDSEGRVSGPAASFFDRVVFADLDRDGSTDLAFVSNALGGRIEVTVLLNDRAKGLLAVSRTYDMVGVSDGDVATVLSARDLDGDGLLDLQINGDGDDVMLNMGHGAFAVTAFEASNKIGGRDTMGCPGCRIVLPNSTGE